MEESLFSALLSRENHSTEAIDWCEANFIHPDIAEFWNCVSSLSYCLVGLSLTVQDYHIVVMRRPLRFAGPLVFILGLASASFHATLKLHHQRLDEVFETFSLVSLLHSAVEPALPALAWPAHTALAFLGVTRVHSFLFTEVHLVLCAVLLGMALVRLAGRAQARGGSSAKGVAQLQGRLLVAASSAAIGALCWLLDRLLCPQLQGAQLHAWWHVLTAVTLHESYAVAALAGSALEGGKAGLRIVAGGLLSVVVEGEDKTP